MLRTSIAMDNRSVKPLAALESPASGGVSVVEPGDGPVTQLWLESVSVLLALLLGQSEETLRQRLREWYYRAADKAGRKRRTLEVEPVSRVVAVGAGVVARRAAGSWRWRWMRRPWDNASRCCA